MTDTTLADIAVNDVAVLDHGSIWTFFINTDAARDWVNEMVDVPEYMLHRNGFRAEHRPAARIVEAMRAEGLTVGGLPARGE